MTVLKIQNLVKNYGTLRAVDQVSFEVNAGEIFGLLGPNGAGKTSIISTIVTLEKPNEGSIHINNMNVLQKPKETKSIIGFVPQEIVTHGYFNVEEILSFQSGYYGLYKNKKRVHQLMKQLELYNHKHKKVRQLSGGMKRRMMIAKALVHYPQLLLLDEPTAGVDVKLRESIWKQIKQLRNTGVAILFTTHYLEEAEHLCDRIAIIDNGKIQKQGETQELIQQLTSRHFTLTVKNNVECSHPCLIQKTGNTLQFRISYSTKMGDFLSELNIQNSNIVDMKIREGTLEEAFKYVLKKDNT